MRAPGRRAPQHNIASLRGGEVNDDDSDDDDDDDGDDVPYV